MPDTFRFRKLAERIGELEKFKDKPVIVCCASGMRSSRACGELKKLGFTNVHNLAGGIDAWIGAGYPVKKGQRANECQRADVHHGGLPLLRARQAIAEARGVSEIEEVRVDLDPERRDEMMQKTQRRTVPQIFIGETHVGGCDDLIRARRGGQAEAAARQASPETGFTN